MMELAESLCSKCDKKEVCKYTEEFLQIEKKKKVLEKDSFFKLYLDCPYFVDEKPKTKDFLY